MLDYQTASPSSSSIESRVSCGLDHSGRSASERLRPVTAEKRKADKPEFCSSAPAQDEKSGIDDAFLVNNTESWPKPENRGFAGDSTALGNNTKSVNPPLRKVERFALQAVSRSILQNARLGKCLRTPFGNQVEVHKVKSTDSFHYRKLVVCGYNWICPVCAAKISEARRIELSNGLRIWNERGHQVVLMTLTVPHYDHQPLSFVLEGITKAVRSFFKCRGVKNALSVLRCSGRVRGLEVTYGDNGWHPHFHILLFNEISFDILSLMSMQEYLLSEWKRACIRSGLSEPNYHGLMLQNGEKAAQYVAKWGLEHELTKSHCKKSKNGYSPFDLLRSVICTYNGTGTQLETEKAKDLYREYDKAFRGRRQLVWSDGLRDLLNLGEERTDEELAESADEDSVIFAKIPLNVWKVVLKTENRGQLLEVCRQGLDPLFDWLILLMECEE